MSVDFLDHDATSLAALVSEGAVTAGELLDQALANVAALNPQLNAIASLREDIARAGIAAGLPEGPLTGVPFLLKDLGAEAVDFPCNGGSRLLQNTVYKANSAIYERIAASGLVTFGRTTSPEGGIGAATEAALYGGPTRNPWDLTRTSGGSSGGAGAAVAAGIVPVAHGSDGGGSVRIPASSCGLVGFKPTRARLPDGPFAGEGWAGMAIDGFLTRSLRDTALLMDLCEGADLGAPYHAPPLRMGFQAAMEQKPGPLRIALCDTTLTGAPLHPECRQAVIDTAKLLENMGHHVEEARPEADTIGMMTAWTDIVACGTALWVNAKLRALGRELRQGDVEGVVRGAVEHAKTVSGERYLASVNKVHAYGREMAGFFQHHDVLLTPTLAEPPAKVGRFAHDTEDYLGFRMGPEGIFAYSPFTAAFNATGQPAISLPLAWSTDNLPIGIHLVTRFGEDELLMSLSAELERARPWFQRRPPVSMQALAATRESTS